MTTSNLPGSPERSPEPKAPRTPADRIRNYRRAIKQLQRSYDLREMAHMRLVADWSAERKRADDSEREVRRLNGRSRAIAAKDRFLGIVSESVAGLAVLVIIAFAASLTTALCVYVWRVLHG